MENTENTAVQATEQSSEQRPERNARPQNRVHRKKVCAFCTERDAVIDYKNPYMLRKYISERGKILPRRMTGTCTHHQHELTVAIKRARQIALLPYVQD